MRMVEGSDVLKSKEENFSGYFQVSEDELRELLRELEDTRRHGIPLDVLLRR